MSSIPLIVFKSSLPTAATFFAFSAACDERGPSVGGGRLGPCATAAPSEEPRASTRASKGQGCTMSSVTSPENSRRFFLIASFCARASGSGLRLPGPQDRPPARAHRSRLPKACAVQVFELFALCVQLGDLEDNCGAVVACARESPPR